jgi:uncharacterized protein with GYD domain
MPKYLFSGSYTQEGISGVLQEGGAKRLEVARRAVESLGGALESYYFAFGGEDFYLTADFPDNASAAALSLAVSASGAANTKVTVLLTPEEVDQAVAKRLDYRPPGA